MRCAQKMGSNSSVGVSRRSAMHWKRSSEGWKHSTPPKSKITARTAILTARAACGLFFAPGANFTHGVDAASLALKIRAGENFAQQAGAEQHHASHQGQR